MAKQKWYSPQLARHVVAQLYRKAKRAGVPMTVFTNRILEEVLGDKPSNTQSAVDNRTITEPS